MGELTEHGLAAHLLYLPATDFGPGDPSRSGASVELSAQSPRDTAETVDEVPASLAPIQVVLAEAHGRTGELHRALADTSGGAAIVGFLAGQPVVHYDCVETIMTNDPSTGEQVALLAQHVFSHPSRDLPIPSNVNLVDRLQRATDIRALLPTPEVGA